MAQVKQQSLIATMADGAILLDAEGRIVLANPTARRLFRWEGRNLEGQELVEELPDLLAIEVHAPLDALLLSGADSEDLRCNVGDPPRTLRIVMPCAAGGESLKGIAVTVQDLTREVELNAAQSRFISNVPRAAHALFNIKSYVETLYDMGDQLSDDEKQEIFGLPTRKPTDSLAW